MNPHQTVTDSQRKNQELLAKTIRAGSRGRDKRLHGSTCSRCTNFDTCRQRTAKNLTGNETYCSNMGLGWRPA